MNNRYSLKIKKNRWRSFAVVCVLGLLTLWLPMDGFADEASIVRGIVQVEEDRIYMLPIGTDNGLKKGDMVDIVRDGTKVAEARLVSVLTDSSMAEIEALFNISHLDEKTDAVQLPEVKKTYPAKETLASRVGNDPYVPPSSRPEPVPVAETRQGPEATRLLGSEAYIQEQIILAKKPLYDEIENLKASMARLKVDYDQKVKTILSSMQGGSLKNFEKVQKKFEKQEEELRKSLEEYRVIKTQLEEENKELSWKLKEANVGSDERINELVANLKKKDATIDLLKKTFEQGRLADQKAWETKLSDIEARHQSELRVQKSSIETGFTDAETQLQNQVADLNMELSRLKEANSKEVNDVQAMLTARQDFINNLLQEKLALEASLAQKNEKLTELERDVAGFNLKMEKLQSFHDEDVKSATKSLEEENKELTDKLIGIRKEYEVKLAVMQESAKNEQLAAERQWVDKLADLEAKYQKETGEFKGNSTNQINQLAAKVDDYKNKLNVLEKEKAVLTAKLSQTEKQLERSEYNTKNTENKLASERASRAERVETAKKPLEQKIKELSAQLISQGEEHERKMGALQESSKNDVLVLEKQLKDELAARQSQYDDLQKKAAEDKSVIEFLNSEMAVLTGDLEKRDQEAQQSQKDIALLKGELEAAETSHGRELVLARQPLEAHIVELTKQLDSVKKDYEGRLKALEEKGQNNLLASEQQWIEQLATVEEKWKDTLASADRQWQVKLAAVKAEYEKEMEGVKTVNDSRIGSVNAQLEEAQKTVKALKDEKSELAGEIIALRKDYDVRFNDLRESAKRSQASIDEQWQVKLAQKEAQHAEEIAALKGGNDLQARELQARLTALTNEYENKLVSVQDGSEEELTRLQKQWEEKLTALEGQWKTKLADSDKAHQEALSALTGGHSNQLTTLQAKLNEKEGEVIRLQEQSRAASAASEEQWKAKLASLVQEYEMKIKSAQEGSREEMAVIQGQWEKKLAGVEGQWQAKLDEQGQLKKEELAASQQDAEVKISETKTRAAALAAEYEERIKAFREKTKEELAASEEKWKAQTADLNRQLDSLIGDENSVVNQLRANLKEKQDILSVLEKEKNDVNAALAQKDGRLVDLEKTVDGLQEELKAKDLAREEALKVLNGELAAVKKQYDEQIAALQAGKEDGRLALEKQWQTKLADVEARYQAELAAVKGGADSQINTLQATVSSVTKEYQAKLTALQESSQAESAASQKQWEEKLAAKEAEYQAELAKVAGGSDQQVKGLQAKLASLTEDYEKKLKSLEDTSKEESAASQKRWEEKLAAAQQQSQDKVVQIQGPLQDQVTELTGQIKRLEGELEKNRLALENVEKEKAGLQSSVDTTNQNMSRMKETMAGLESKLAEEQASREERVKLAKESAKAEIDALKFKLTFVEEDYKGQLKRSVEYLRAAEEQWKAKLAAREEEYQKQLAVEKQNWEQQITGNSKDLRETVVALNDRFSMLKNASDNQIRELETNLAAQQSQLALKEAETQKRLAEVENQWALKLGTIEKGHQEELLKQKQVLEEGFLKEKKEWRESIVDLNTQFAELRENSSSRIKALEADLEAKESQLSLFENRTQQSLVGAEEKWRVQLATAEETRQKDLAQQKQDMEYQFAAEKNKLQAVVADLTKQMGALREQSKLDLAMKDQELAAEVALVEGKYQKELSNLNKGEAGKIEELAKKVEGQQEVIGSLTREKANLAFDLEQKAREMADLKTQMDGLKQELKLAEVSRSEKLKLSKESSQAEIEEVMTQLAVVKQKAEQDREALEERWKAKLAKIEQDYVEKLKLQQKNLEDEAVALKNQLSLTQGQEGNTVKELQVELEDAQTLIRLLSKEKYELTDGLEQKGREVVQLNEEIIGLKEDLESYKTMLPMTSTNLPSSQKTDKASAKLQSVKKEKTAGPPLASKEEVWYDDRGSFDEYYATVRKAILSKFQSFDFSDFEGKEGIVKIDFELLANGAPKGGPEFSGTENEGLKGLLKQCFQAALPFPPFPENLGKESQRFSLSISFKK